MTKSIWAPQAAWVYEKEGKRGNPLLPVDSLYQKVGGLHVHHVQKPPHTKLNVQTSRRSWKGELVQKLLGLAKSTWSPETSRCQAALPNPKLVGPSWLMIKRSMVTTNLSWVSNLKVWGPLLVFFFSMRFHKSQVYDIMIPNQLADTWGCSTNQAKNPRHTILLKLGWYKYRSNHNHLQYTHVIWVCAHEF